MIYSSSSLWQGIVGSPYVPTEVKTDSSQTKAYNILKDTASKTQNVRLAMLASKVYTGPPARTAGWLTQNYPRDFMFCCASSEEKRLIIE